MTAPASAPALRIFAGTTEGRLLCEWASRAGIPARAYAATEYGGELLGELPGIEVHAGRLDDADMERELSGACIVVDATHPFATLASGNIRAASLAVGVRCLRLARPVEALPKGVVPVASIACAARFLSENPGRALLTTGSKELAPYTSVADFAERFFVRVLPLPGAITKCIDAGFSPSHVIGMQGPFTRELNEAMLRQVGAQWLVTKDSGTVGGTAEKLAAARAVGARCIVVTRPAESSALCVTGGLLGVLIGYLLAWGLAMFASGSGILGELGASGQITPSFSIATVLLAFAVSVGIGVIFGFYPARRAAKLDPVECLRYQ